MNILEKGSDKFLDLFLLMKKRTFFILLLFFTIPLSYGILIPYLGVKISFPSEIIITVFSIYIISTVNLKSINKEFWKHPVTIILLIDTAWLLITSFTSTDLLVSFKRVFMRVNFLLLSYFFLALWFRDKDKLLKPSILYCIGFIPVILFIFYKFSYYDFFPSVSSYVCKPFYDDHTIYSASLVFLLPILLLLLIKRDFFIQNKAIKLFGLPLLTVLFSTAIFLSYSRASWLSVIVGFIFFLLLMLKLKPIYYLLGLIAIISIVFNTKDIIYKNITKNKEVSKKGDLSNHINSVTNISTDVSNLERINKWVCAYRMFKEKPFLGFGPGTYQFEYAQFQTLDFKTRLSSDQGGAGNAHSEYFTYLSESGLIGLITFLSLIFVTVYTGIKNSLQTVGDVKWVNNALLVGLVTYFFHGFFNSFIDQEKVALLIFSAMAGIVAIDLYHKNKQGEGLV